MHILIPALLAASHPLAPQPDGCLATTTLPAPVRPFVEPGTCAITLERGDLDRDGRGDFVLVLEQTAAPRDPDGLGRARTLVLLATAPDGRLHLAARNTRVVMCSQCGGTMGDPFQGVEVTPGHLTISHYGGSSWRWTASYTFAYSARDRAWQLTRVETSNFHSSDPEHTMKTKVERPPRDFGKIDLRAFDPDKYRGVGER